MSNGTCLRCSTNVRFPLGSVTRGRGMIRVSRETVELAAVMEVHVADGALVIFPFFVPFKLSLDSR